MKESVGMHPLLMVQNLQPVVLLKMTLVNDEASCSRVQGAKPIFSSSAPIQPRRSNLPRLLAVSKATLVASKVDQQSDC